MKTANPQASKKLRIVAAVCLATILVATWRIFNLSSLDQLVSVWEGPQVYTKSMILSMLVYGFFASTYIVFTGRKPIGLRSPFFHIDEKSELSRPEKIRKGITLTCGGAFILYILYLFIFVIPNAA